MAQTIPDRSTVWIRDPEKDSAESFVKSTVRWSRAALHMRCTRARSARSLHVHCTFTAHAPRQVLPARPRVHRDDARRPGEDAAAGGRGDGQPRRDGAA
eukprot:scaffold19746_cov67-Phaeocystis_antarctica.AAC.6